MKQLNTIILTTLISISTVLVGWNLFETYNIRAETSATAAGNGEAHKRIEDKLDTMVPRREMELRISQIETELHKLDLRIIELNNQLRKNGGI